MAQGNPDATASAKGAFRGPYPEQGREEAARLGSRDPDLLDRRHRRADRTLRVRKGDLALVASARPRLSAPRYARSPPSRAGTHASPTQLHVAAIPGLR